MKVIVAVDQSEYASQIIDAVLTRPWPQNVSFKLLTVVVPFQWEQIDLPGWSSLAKDVYDKRTETALKMLQKDRARLAEQVGEGSVHVDIRHGSAREEILKAATEWMPDKIVVGAHGHSPNRLLGSVPRALSRLSPCSVELIRLKEVARTSEKAPQAKFASHH
jgi:nucleotide-binding universal stress UspA family protein